MSVMKVWRCIAPARIPPDTPRKRDRRKDVKYEGSTDYIIENTEVVDKMSLEALDLSDKMPKRESFSYVDGNNIDIQISAAEPATNRLC